jgi:Pyruvate/2-oxoacid:ferredoxin oxidoreductase delta subunit
MPRAKSKSVGSTLSNTSKSKAEDAEALPTEDYEQSSNFRICAVCDNDALLSTEDTGVMTRCRGCNLCVHVRCMGEQGEEYCRPFGKSSNTSTVAPLKQQHKKVRSKVTDDEFYSYASGMKRGREREDSIDTPALFCPLCRANRKETPPCALCGTANSHNRAMLGSEPLWAHVYCLQWRPHAHIAVVERSRTRGGKETDEEGIHVGEVRLSKLYTQAEEKASPACIVCNQKAGITVHCSSSGCPLSFHPLCARGLGWAMKNNATPLEAYCGTHSSEDALQAAALRDAVCARCEERGGEDKIMCSKCNMFFHIKCGESSVEAASVAASDWL